MSNIKNLLKSFGIQASTLSAPSANIVDLSTVVLGGSDTENIYYPPKDGYVSIASAATTGTAFIRINTSNTEAGGTIYPSYSRSEVVRVRKGEPVQIYWSGTIQFYWSKFIETVGGAS